MAALTFTGTLGDDDTRTQFPFIGSADTLTATLLEGDDQFFGFDGSYFAFGGAGADFIQGGASGGEGYGGSGNDRLLAGPTGLHHLFGGTGDDELVTDNLGDAIAVTLYGGDGTDRFQDWLLGGGDHFRGGAGFDYVEHFMPTGVTVSLESGAGGGAAAGNTYVGIEGLKGSAFGDRLVGDDQANVLVGWFGSDTLFGGGGDDLLVSDEMEFRTFTGARPLEGLLPVRPFSRTDSTALEWRNAGGGDFSPDSLYGGRGNDVLMGGDGGELLHGGVGRDAANYLDSPTGVAVDLAAGTGLFGTAQGDQLIAIEDVLGSVFFDSLSGDDGSNLLRGRAGSDSLFGRSGNDTLKGEAGADTLAGEAGSDRLEGGAGRDHLDGGADSDRDVFVYSYVSHSRPGASHDLIDNFIHTVDDLDLHGIDARPTSAADNAFAWANTTAAAHAVWWTSTTGGLLVRADVTGDTTADLEVLLKGVSTFGAGDVLL